jgi:hypothetical protein
MRLLAPPSLVLHGEIFSPTTATCALGSEQDHWLTRGPNHPVPFVTRSIVSDNS